MHRIITILIISMTVCLAPPLRAADWPPRSYVVAMAEDFLAHIDVSDYLGARQMTSALHQALTPIDHWGEKLRILHQAYGSLLSREPWRVDNRTTYFHSPDGTYSMVQFHSNFANKRETIETVVLECPSATDCSVRDYIIR